MNYILMPSILTILFIFMGIFSGKAYRYVFFFFIMVGLEFLLSFNKCQADEISLPQIKLYYAFPDNPLDTWTEEQMQYLKEANWAEMLEEMAKINEHRPSILKFAHGDEMDSAIEITVAAAFAKTIKAAGIIALTIYLTKYLQYAYYEWKDLNYHLGQAKLCLEMYEFYDEILRKNNEMFPKEESC